MHFTNDWNLLNIEELKIQLHLALFYMIRTIFLRQWIFISCLFLVAEIVFLISFKIDIYQLM